MHRFGRRNTQDDGLVLGQVTDRDAMHDRGVGGDVFGQHLPHIVSERIVHRLPVSDGVVVQFGEAPTKTPRTRSKTPASRKASNIRSTW